MLSQWLGAGWCVAGLVYAVDHTPDGTRRGDALRSARSPLGVLGHRLSLWRDQADRLPADRQAVDPDEREARRVRLAAELEQLDDAGRRGTAPHIETSDAAHRAALLAELRNRKPRRVSVLTNTCSNK